MLAAGVWLMGTAFISALAYGFGKAKGGELHDDRNDSL